MNLIEAIKTRKSIRGYKADQVPKKVLKDILEIASRAPSAVNSQPWEFTVITSEVLEKIKRANVEKFMSGITSQTRRNTGVYRERQIAIAVQLFQLMNIGREDREKTIEWTKRGFRFFDAPAVIIISTDSSLGEAARFGIGAVSQTIALTALNYGLGTCIQRQAISYPDVIREFTGILKYKQIIICISIGYPDWDFPANQVQSEREAIENITTWCGIW